MIAIRNNLVALAIFGAAVGAVAHAYNQNNTTFDASSEAVREIRQAPDVERKLIDRCKAGLARQMGYTQDPYMEVFCDCFQYVWNYNVSVTQRPQTLIELTDIASQCKTATDIEIELYGRGAL